MRTFLSNHLRGAQTIVALLTLGGCATQDSGPEIVASESSLCMGVQVGWTPGAVPLDGTVQLTANGATCGAGEVAEYKYWYRRETAAGGGAYTLLQNWTQSTTSTGWNTEAVPSGRYSLRVQARNVGSTVANGDSNQVKATFVGDVCTSVVMVASPGGTQPVGTARTFSATSTCVPGAPQAQYRFAKKPIGTPSSAYVEFRGWSTNPVATWNTASEVAGEYNVIAYVRSGFNLVDEAQDVMTVRLGESCGPVTLTSNPTASAPLDTPVALTASASCTGSVQPQYQFLYRVGSSGAFTLIPGAGWSSTPTATWTTLGLPKGAYQVRAEVRGNDYAGSWQASQNRNFTLGDYCGSASITVTPSSQPQTLGTTVTLTGLAGCDNGMAEYKFYYRTPGSTTDQPVAPGTWGGNTATFSTTNPSGQYNFRVDVRAIGSAGAVQATDTRGFNFGNVCNSLNFAALTASPQAAGTSVSLQSNATCTSGATAEYQLAYRLGTSGAFTLFPGGWSTSTLGTWNTAGLGQGTYELRSQTRAVGNNSSAEATRTVTFSLVCPSGHTPVGNLCVDDDECALNTDTCAASQICANTPGSYTCTTCPAGTFSDGTACTTVAQVSAGWDHSCATSASGALYCWGSNDYGQLGDGTTTSSNMPVRIGTDTNWASVVTGFFASCGVRTDGTLWCWGWNGAGQLGDGTTNDSLDPVQVGIEIDWDSVDLGYYHACGLRTGGTLWCWGYNGDGELGNGTTTDSLAPFQVGSSTDWASASAGGFHSCGVRSNGTLWCWGWNSSGEVGIGSTTQQNAPVQVGSATDWDSVTGGGSHTCGVRSNGTLWCWGDNSVGALGDGTVVSQSSPVQAGTDTDWAIAAGGGLHTCALRTTGTLWCWGHNDYGAVGDGSVTTRSSPTQVGTSTGWTDIASGDYFSGGVNGGLPFFWGDNSRGQLGDNTTTEQHAPGAAIAFY